MCVEMLAMRPTMETPEPGESDQPFEDEPAEEPSPDSPEESPDEQETGEQEAELLVGA
jgi:hypothetical protein